MQRYSRATCLFLGALFVAVATRGWDYEGHRIVNQLGLAALPADFPAFVREPANAGRIAFLSGEPDRWRNVPDLPIKHYNGLDHYCDLEQLADAGLAAATVPSLRYEFALQFAAGRAAHPEKFPAVDPTRNTDHSREWPGFAPWAITEYYGKLKSAFSCLKVFEEAGTPEEIANAQADAVYLMGVMGHYVGDCAQPLHTTKHHNGWVGANPHGYTTWGGIHSWIDGGFLAKSGIRSADFRSMVVPAKPINLVAKPEGRDPMFGAVMDYLLAQQKFVEPLYVLEKAGKFSHEKDEPVQPEGREFIKARLLTGGEMLAAIWLTAWKQAAPDTYLRAQLLRRQTAAPSAK
jgi:hypothetical protein